MAKGGYLWMPALVLVCIAARLLPHHPNFTPVAAAGMFAGYVLGRRYLAFWVPLLALAISDAYLGWYDLRLMAVVYLTLCLPVVLGRCLQSRLRVPWVGCFALASSILFFVATNLAVWSFGGMYPRDLTGLLNCFESGLPFFKYTVMGDLFWSLAFFGGYSLARAWASKAAASRLAHVPVSDGRMDDPSRHAPG